MTDGLRIAHLRITPQWAILRWAILTFTVIHLLMMIMIYFVLNRGQSGKSQIASTRSQYIFIAKTIYKVSSKKLPISLKTYLLQRFGTK